MAEITMQLCIDTDSLASHPKDVAGHLLKSAMNIAEGHPGERGTLSWYTSRTATLVFVSQCDRRKPTAEYELHVERGNVRVEKHST